MPGALQSFIGAGEQHSGTSTPRDFAVCRLMTKLDELSSIAREDRVRGDEQSVRFPRRKRRESVVNFSWTARVNDFELLSDLACRLGDSRRFNWPICIRCPLTVTDHASRFLLLCEGLESTREDLA